MLGPDEVEVVGRGVVLGEPPVRRAHQAPDRKIEPRRAVLPLVVAVGHEVMDLVLAARVPQHVLDGPVDGGVAPATTLVRGVAAIADAREDQAVPDARGRRLVEREPRDRPDRAGDEEEAVRVAERCAGEGACQRHGDRDPRQVVVRERGVAAMARDQDLLVRPAADDAFAVRQAAGREARVDADLVLAFRERLELPVRQAEPPVLLVVRGPVRNPVGPIRQRMEPRPQLLERQPRPDGNAVVDHVEVAALEVHHPPAVLVLDVRVPDVPLVWDRPVEHPGSARHLVDLERDLPAEAGEGPADAVARDAPTDRVQLLDQRVHRAAGPEIRVAHLVGT